MKTHAELVIACGKMNQNIIAIELEYDSLKGKDLPFIRFYPCFCLSGIKKYNSLKIRIFPLKVFCIIVTKDWDNLLKLHPAL